jgi:hypothetical protein
MAKRKEITVYLNSRDGATVLSTYKRELAEIYFLEDDDCKGFSYHIHYGSSCWDEKTFKNEIDAVKYICKGLLDSKYDSIRLRYGNYSNSEVGFVRGWENGVIRFDL